MMSKRIINIFSRCLAIATIVLSTTSCYDDGSIYDIETGGQLDKLGFSFNGEHVREKFRNYITSDCCHIAGMDIDEESNTLHIRALLNHDFLYKIDIELPYDKIQQGLQYEANVKLLYTNIEFKNVIDDNGNKSSVKGIRRYAKISSSRLQISKCNIEGDKKELAGHFEFSGYYLDELNNPIDFNVTEGQFYVRNEWDRRNWLYEDTKYYDIIID